MANRAMATNGKHYDGGAKGGKAGVDAIIAANNKYSRANGLSEVNGVSAFNKAIAGLIRSTRQQSSEEKTAVSYLRRIHKASDVGTMDGIIEGLSNDGSVSNDLYSALYGFALNKSRLLNM